MSKQQASDKALKGEPCTSRKFEILIIEDDDETLIKLEGVLEAAGHRTTTAWCARQAVSLLRKKQFDVILLDDYLGGIDWRQVVQQLGPMSKGSPFIVLHPTSADCLDAAGAAPAFAMVCKWAPYDVLEMVKCCVAISSQSTTSLKGGVT